MKLKKLFAGILAVAMMATMAAPAFATTGGTEIDPAKKSFTSAPNGVILLDKSYSLSHGIFDSDTVNLELVDFSDGKKVQIAKSSLTEDDAQSLLPQFAAANVSKDENGALTGTQISITLPDYQKVGVYTYQVKETKGNTLGMSYDETTYTMTVNVVNATNADGKIDGTNKVCYVNFKNGTTKVLDITNAYNAGTLNVTKDVEGNMGDRSTDTTFDFKVTLTVPAGKVMNSTLTVPDNATLVWNESKTVATVTTSLSHGETLSIGNIPYGMTYVVDEMNGQNAVADGNKNGNYEVKYDDHKAGTIDKEYVNGEAVVSTTVTNTFGETNVDTGVILDNAPYIALMMVVVAGAAVMIIKKRRHFED